MADSKLRARWQTPEGQSRAEEVLARLVAGRPLDGLGLGDVGGRVDLRALPAPIPCRLARFEVDGWFVERLGNLVKLEGVTLQGLDLSDAFLNNLLIRDSVIEDCVLDRARCHELGVARSQIRNTSFRAANLRESGLGSWHEGKGNIFEHVDFTKADLRDADPMTASFDDCDFSLARLDRVQFKRCLITGCRFSGHLKEVVFDGRVFDPAENEPNYYERIDMSGAIFQLVEFRGFNIDAVHLPNDPKLRILRNYPCILRKGIEILRDREDRPGRRVRAFLKNDARGIDKGFPLGLYNRADFEFLGGEEMGEEMATLADDVFREAESACEAD